MTPPCPSCRSTFVLLTLETATRRFHHCEHCDFRWNVLTGPLPDMTQQCSMCGSHRLTPRCIRGKQFMACRKCWAVVEVEIAGGSTTQNRTRRRPVQNGTTPRIVRHP
jgi:hypothetical protein